MLVRFTLAVNGCEVGSYEPIEVALNVNPDLLSGFLEAMETFSAELNNPVKEIKFSNWIIYINKGSDFTIRLIVTEFIRKDLLEEILKQLRTAGEKIAPNFSGGQTIRPEVIKDIFVPLLRPLMSENLIDPLKKDTKLISDSALKINFAGLGAVGKTSLKRRFLEHLSSNDALNTKPTLGIEANRKQIDYLHTTLNIQEFGGQAAFRQKYLTNKSYWLNTSTLIFVVDIQKPELFAEAASYLHSLVQIITEVNNEPPILSIFFHKYDPALREDLSKNLSQGLAAFVEFQQKSTIHLTSLLDNSSNIAILKSIYQFLPSIMLQNMLVEDFLKDIKDTLLPRFTPLISDNSAQLDEELVQEIKMSSTFFGRTYGAKFQKNWIKYLTEICPITAVKQTDEIIVKKEGNKFSISVKKDKIYPNLFTIVVFGALTGLTRSLQFQTPKLIGQTDEIISWQIQFTADI